MKHDGQMQRWLSETAGNAIRREQSASACSGTTPSLRTISACSQAFLDHYGIDPAGLYEFSAAPRRAGIEIGEVRTADAHLTMTMKLPLPWKSGQMTIVTHVDPVVILPGMAFSSTIAETAIGRPLNRLVGHPALQECQMIVITKIEHAEKVIGSSAAILHFRDNAEPLRPRY